MQDHNNWIIGICQEDAEYKIGGVCYVVSSQFRPFGDMDSLQDRMRHIIQSKIVDLTGVQKQDKIGAGYMCSATGKED